MAMDKVLKTAYEQLEEEITACLKEHRGNHSVVSTMLNTLLAWPDHPYGFGTLYGSEFNPETKCRERFARLFSSDPTQNPRPGPPEKFGTSTNRIRDPQQTGTVSPPLPICTKNGH